MPIRFPLDDLEEMADEHVFYEVDRLGLWTGGLGVPITIHGSPAYVAEIQALLSQAALESALVHLRNVADFLTSDRPTSGRYVADLVADDYFDEGWPTKSRLTHVLGPEPKDDLQTRIELNKRVFHVSTARLDAKRVRPFDWSFVIQHVPNVLEAFERFVNTLGGVHPRRGLWFDRAMASIRAVTPR